MSYPRNPKLAQLAFTFAAGFQIWSVFLYRDIEKLTFADEQLLVTFDWMAKGADTLNMESKADKECLKIAFTTAHQYIEKVAGISADGMKDFFARAVGGVIDSIILDPQDDIVALFSSDETGEVVSRFFSAAPPAYVWQGAMAKGVLGVDDAASSVQ